MPEIHVPFFRGEHAEIDTKLLPQGTLSHAENVRFAKDGRVVSRRGYAFVDDATTPAEPAQFSAAWRTDRTLLFYSRSSGPSTFREMLPDGTHTTAIKSSAGGTWEAPVRWVAAQRAQYSVTASDCAYVNGYLFCVYQDFDTDAAAAGALQYAVYHYTTRRLVASGTIVDYGVATEQYFNPKCIALGTDVFTFYRVDNDMRFFKISMSSLIGGNITLSPAISAETSDGEQISFDVCPFDGDEVALCVESLTGSSSTGIKAYKVTAAGATTEFISSTAYGSTRKQVGIAKAPISAGDGYVVSAVTDGDVYVGAFNSAGTVLDAPAIIDSSGNCRGAPCSGTSETEEIFVCWAVSSSSPTGKMGVWGYSTGTVKYVPSVFPAAKPFETPDGGDAVWTVDRIEADTPGFGTYKLFDLTDSYTADIDGGGLVLEAVAAQEQALSGAHFATAAFDQRRHTVTIPVDSDFGTDALVTALPILVGISVYASRVDFVEIRTGEFVDACHAAHLNGQLFLSGARLREFDGSQLYESGLGQGPGVISVSTAVGEARIAAGDRFYKIIWKWIDAAGRIHRSQPSDTQTCNTVVASDHTLTIEAPPCTARTANGRPTIFAEIYRTIDNGSVFFLVNPNARPTFLSGLDTPLTYVDGATDAEISVNEQLYTEGDVLDNEEPPPCRYLAAGESRLLMAGLEDPSAYRFSRSAVPGLAVTFTTDVAFGGTVNGDVTGCAHLDGVFYIGTRDAIWAVGGDGPDDLGDGQFTRPRSLPSDSGFKNHRSIVEVPQGLLFQGGDARIYLLPRGGGAPSWIGQAVRDVTDAYPFVTWARFIPEQNVAIFSCVEHTTSETDGVFLVYDTRIGEWVRDVWLADGAGVPASHVRLTRCASVREGRLLIDGNVQELEGGYWDTADGEQLDAITMTLITGDIRPFGVQGDGRVRAVTLLGEEGSEASITIDVSRDSGTTWDTPAGAWTGISLTDLRYDTPRVRGTEFRVRIRATPSVEDLEAPAENAIINSLSLEIFPATGTKRLGSGQKR